MSTYKNFINGKKILKETEYKSKMIFSLPIYPTLKNTKIEFVIKSLKDIVSKI